MATIEEKVTTGEDHKNKGNESFKAQDFKKALASYHMAILYLKGLDNSALDLGMGNSKPLSKEIAEKILKLMIATWSNMAACYLKLEQLDKAVEVCDKVLDKDSKNVKAMFRKGQALFGLNHLEKAKKLLKEAATLAPNDSGIRQELQKVKDRLAELDKKSREELMENLSKQ